MRIGTFSPAIQKTLWEKGKTGENNFLSSPPVAKNLLYSPFYKQYCMLMLSYNLQY